MSEETGPRLFVVGGLHADDFHWAKTTYEVDGWILVAFKLEEDHYHWCARFVRNEALIGE